MKIKLIGDIHLGKKFPYTTQRSAEYFEDWRTKILETHTSSIGIQLGDLFDSFSVSDHTLIQGYRWMQGAQAVLSGNHDVSNNTDKTSAIKLLKDNLDVKVIWQEPEQLRIGNTVFHLVPHQLTQELFEQCLDNLKTELGWVNVLLLHCNYGDRLGTATENYLRRDNAKEVCKKFHLVVSGHEHNFSGHKNLIMLGSIMPFSFGEMTDKFIMEYDCDTGEHELIRTFKSDCYKQLSFQEFLDSPVGKFEFIEVVGNPDPGPASDILKRIAYLYKETDVIAVKNSTVIYRHEKQVGEIQDVQDWLADVKRNCDAEHREILEQLLGEL